MDEAIYYFYSNCQNMEGIVNILNIEYNNNTFQIWYTIEELKKKKNFFGF